MSLKNVPFGNFHPEEPVINAVIENPAGSRQKFSYDEKIDATVLTRILPGELEFPFNYGYIPQTRSGDEAHVDVWVISSHVIPGHMVVPSRPIGMIEVEDRGKRDNKIIAVPLDELAYRSVENWNDLPVDLQKKLKDFYDEYVRHLGNNISIKGYFGKQKAIEELRLTQILE